MDKSTAVDPLTSGELALKEEFIHIDKIPGMSSCSGISLSLSPKGDGEVSFCDGSSKTIKGNRKLYEKSRSVVVPFRKVSRSMKDNADPMRQIIPCGSRATDSGSILIRWGADNKDIRITTFDLGCKGAGTLTAQAQAKAIFKLIETLQ